MKKRGCIIAVLAMAAFLGLIISILPIGRWWKLQCAGQVSEGASHVTFEGEREWRLAESTTWWGKPLDPSVFWKDRVIWIDESALDAAYRHGRGYPPIPTHSTNLTAHFHIKSYSHKDIVSGPVLDGGRVTYHITEAEDAYWNCRFWRTMPKPPTTLEREQFDVAESILRQRKPLIINGRDLHASTSRYDFSASAKSRAQEIGVPKEALTEDALFWAYVMKQRQVYSKEQAEADVVRAHAPEVAKRYMDGFFARLCVDAKFITDPLTPEQIKSATKWKYAYLKRLRQEGIDSSYINAYLKTWKLDHAEVFQ
jgi:hypothetical protein